MTFIRSFILLISFFPALIQVAILGFFAICIILCIFKLVALVLDAIPFV